MATNAHDAYLESRVLSADPVELVRMLYRVAIERTREARQHLEDGDTVARSKAISAASLTLAELTAALDLEKGGQLSRRLAQLYDYMQCRLMEANFEQRAEPLNEVVGLLSTLLEGWSNVSLETPAAPEPETHGPYAEDAAVYEYSPAGWTG